MVDRLPLGEVDQHASKGGWKRISPSASMGEGLDRRSPPQAKIFIWLLVTLWSPDSSTRRHRDKEVTTYLALCILTPPHNLICGTQNWIVGKTRGAGNYFCPKVVGEGAVVWGRDSCCSSSQWNISVIVQVGWRQTIPGSVCIWDRFDDRISKLSDRTFMCRRIFRWDVAHDVVDMTMEEYSRQ